MNASQTDNLDVLNDLLILHNRSLIAYLSDAVPYVGRGEEPVAEQLRSMAQDHRAMVDRLGRNILELRGAVNHGVFPIQFTDLHDLSLEYLLGELICRQQSAIENIETCVERVQGDPELKGVAEEALGEAKAHLDVLKELCGQTKPT